MIRERGVQIDSENLANLTRDAFMLEDFMAFEDSLGSPHARLHTSFLCDMRDIDTVLGCFKNETLKKK